MLASWISLRRRFLVRIGLGVTDEGPRARALDQDRGLRLCTRALDWGFAKGQSRAVIFRKDGCAENLLSQTRQATKAALDSAVPATRTAATKLLGVMHTFVGPPMLASFGEVKPALLKLLEDECKRMVYDAGKSSAPPARSVRKPSGAGA